jgi:hypothetical protein
VCSIKTDGRLYCANLRNEANGNGDVNQAALVTPKGKWVDFRIKASDFILTSRGLINTERFRMNLREVKTFGIALMDMENGTQPELDFSALPRTSEEEMCPRPELAVAPLSNPLLAQTSRAHRLSAGRGRALRARAGVCDSRVRSVGRNGWDLLVPLGDPGAPGRALGWHG